jgi:E3 Ubiquitin ligase
MQQGLAISLWFLPPHPAVAAAFGALAGSYCFYRGFRLLRRKRLLLNTPASKIRSASMGLVEISGLATGPYVLISPLRQFQCYYYRSLAWEWKQSGKNRQWVKVADESLHVPFYLDDNTGKLLVDPRGAEMDLHCDLHQEYNRSALFQGPEMPGPVSAFLSRHGVDPTKAIKVEEYSIKPKNFLFVLGTLSQNPGLDVTIQPAWTWRAGEVPNPASRQESAARSAEGGARTEVIRLSGGTEPAVSTSEMTQQQKIAAALIKAGITNLAAWTAAGVAAQVAQVALESRPAAGLAASTDAGAEHPESEGEFDLHPPVVLMKGHHEPAFLISWRSQREVVQSLGWKSALLIWGGPLLALACIYFLLAYYSWLKF